MKSIALLVIVSGIFLTGCADKNNSFDATGTFEADEVVVSAELSGRILSLQAAEGDLLQKDSTVGWIDADNLQLQKEQVEANIRALSEKTVDVNPQIRLLEDQLAVQQSRLDNLLHEKSRIENLLRKDAATGKQLDDINAQIDMQKKEMLVTRQQVQVQRNNAATQNRSILSESKPLEKRVAQLDDQLKRAAILNPVTGTVTTRYAEPGEVTTMGKALYKIADLSVLNLRAYITGSQLSQIKLGQEVTVLVDEGAKKYRQLKGTITWIADKAEFTPKTIQTKEERASLVYAIKIKVKNDGLLKLGMYGEVKF